MVKSAIVLALASARPRSRTGTGSTARSTSTSTGVTMPIGTTRRRRCCARDCSIHSQISTTLPACVRSQMYERRAAGRFGWTYICNLLPGLVVGGWCQGSLMLLARSVACRQYCLCLRHANSVSSSPVFRLGRLPPNYSAAIWENGSKHHERNRTIGTN